MPEKTVQELNTLKKHFEEEMEIFVPKHQNKLTFNFIKSTVADVVINRVGEAFFPSESTKAIGVNRLKDLVSKVGKSFSPSVTETINPNNSSAELDSSKIEYNEENQSRRSPTGESQSGKYGESDKSDLADISPQIPDIKAEVEGLITRAKSGRKSIEITQALCVAFGIDDTPISHELKALNNQYDLSTFRPIANTSEQILIAAQNVNKKLGEEAIQEAFIGCKKLLYDNFSKVVQLTQVVSKSVTKYIPHFKGKKIIQNFLRSMWTFFKSAVLRLCHQIVQFMSEIMNKFDLKEYILEQNRREKQQLEKRDIIRQKVLEKDERRWKKQLEKRNIKNKSNTDKILYVEECGRKRTLKEKLQRPKMMEATILKPEDKNQNQLSNENKNLITTNSTKKTIAKLNSSLDNHKKADEIGERSPNLAGKNVSNNKHITIKGMVKDEQIDALNHTNETKREEVENFDVWSNKSVTTLPDVFSAEGEKALESRYHKMEFEGKVPDPQRAKAIKKLDARIENQFKNFNKVFKPSAGTDWNKVNEMLSNTFVDSWKLSDDKPKHTVKTNDKSLNTDAQVHNQSNSYTARLSSERKLENMTSTKAKGRG